MKAMLQAVSFLTRIPVPNLNYSTEDWQRSVRYYPVVGALIGLLLWGVHAAAMSTFSPQVSAVLTLLFWVYITGGLHLDGWMDLADGLGSNRSREQMLTIMKDSRVGAMGVIAAISLFLLKGVTLADFFTLPGNIRIIAVPLVARTLVMVMMRSFPYLARDGIALGMREALNVWSLGFGCVFMLSVGWFLGSWQLLVAIGIAACFAVVFAFKVYRKLGGLTGDVYGALIESTEAVCLLGLLAVGRWLS
ncbi:adenosylcobinamide-GDP ribazoletransferase [Brevibacillus migulae]|uniref:adenosylcobinamide-GDP ribazoletransferase n=1 Tax=Brevibacillus migulae TaxID=1644114 RepID=UPI00106DD387|nr:adenosylcobinamide-GDP ribazoletransferase [Brevibacillus migulae]